MARQIARDSCQAPKSPPKLSFISRSLKFKQGKDQKWSNPSLPWPCAVPAKPASCLLYHKVDLVPCGSPEMRAQGQSDHPSYGDGRARGCLVSVQRCGAPAQVGFPTCPRWWEWERESHQGHQWRSPGFSRGIALSPPWPQTLLSLRVMSLRVSLLHVPGVTGIGEEVKAWLVQTMPVLGRVPASCLSLNPFHRKTVPHLEFSFSSLFNYSLKLAYKVMSFILALPYICVIILYSIVSTLQSQPLLPLANSLSSPR